MRSHLKTLAALSASGLYKRYGHRRAWALENVDLDIPKGAVAALVGPNGAGKSTLLRTWLGFERPTRGSVSIGDGPATFGAHDAPNSVAYVPQGTAAWPGLTVADHVDYAGVLRPGFDAAAAFARLRGLGMDLDRRASTLSGGERAQLVLALALSCPAEALLLDEPLASLDPLARRDFLRTLKAAVDSRGQTVVLSSHIVNDLESICDWIVILVRGRVALQGSIAAVLAEHRITFGIPTGHVIGRYEDVDGSRKELVRGGEGRSATLEEVVIGYLASAGSHGIRVVA